MRLSLIIEGPAGVLKARYGKARFNQYKDALSFIPQRKIDHSMRVGATVARSGLDNEAVEAAILHDYIERGGDLAKLTDINISPKALRIIKMLSLDEKTPGLDDTELVQQHIQQMLADPTIDTHDKNIAIIVKCADRIDNLKKRIRKNELEPAYAIASQRLFITLLSRYTGDPELVRHTKRRIAKLTSAISAATMTGDSNAN